MANGVRSPSGVHYALHQYSLQVDIYLVLLNQHIHRLFEF